MLPKSDYHSEMEVDFGKSGLEVAVTEDFGTLRLPISVIQSLRKKLSVLRAAPDERTLRNWQSLHYEKLKGNRSHQRSIRLNKQWRLIFELVSKPPPPKIVLIRVEDYH